MTGGVRLFFALSPPQPVQADLAAAGAALSLVAPARPVPIENFHLTVAFVGEVPADSLGRLRRIGRERPAPAFAINFVAYEYWPKPQVVVAAARAIPEALQSLWDDLHRALAGDGFELRVKRLRPHVTLAHRVAADPRLPVFTPIAWVARDLCLIRSQSGADQPVYTVVDTWSLLDKPARA
jgi:RNA 2',3'-cyclic 3'-phosphodiesterase